MNLKIKQIIFKEAKNIDLTRERVCMFTVVLKRKCKIDPDIKFLGLDEKTRLFSYGEKRKLEHLLNIFW